MKKIVVLVSLMALSVALFVSCEKTDGSSDTLKEFTMEEVSKYNGKDGMKAYVVYKNSVYDVTPKWKNGEHNGNKAGTDITDVIEDAPHGISVLGKIEKVGTIKK